MIPSLSAYLKFQVERFRKSKILRAMTIVGFFTGVMKLASLVKELIIAKTLGTSDSADAFLIALLIPNYAANIFFGSYSSAFSPTYINVKEKFGLRASRALFSTSVFTSTALTLGITFLLFLFGPELLSYVTKGFSPEKYLLSEQLYKYLLPFLFLTGINVAWGTTLNCEERFGSVALAPITSPICITLAILFFYKQFGIQSLVGGTLIGLAGESLILFFLLKNIGLSSSWKHIRFDKNYISILGQYWPILASSVFINSNLIVDQAMAANLASGSVSTLNYATKIVFIALSVSSVAIGTGVLPYFSQMVATNDIEALKKNLAKYSKLILGFSLPLCFLFVFFSEEIVSFIYERGAFHHSDTIRVAKVQGYYAIQIPFYLLAIIGMRTLNSLKANNTLLKITFFNAVLNVLGNIFLIEAFGLSGIAVSTSIVSIISCTLIFFSIYRRIYAIKTVQQDFSNTTVESHKSTGEKPKICFVIASLSSGGAERVLSIVANEFSKKFYEVHVMIFDSPGNQPFYPLDSDIKLTQLNIPGNHSSFWARAFRNLKRMQILRQEIKNIDPDILISFMDFVNVLTRMATLGTGIPVVVSERTDPEKAPLPKSDLVLRNLSYRLSSQLVVQTQKVSDYFYSNSGLDSVVIPNSIQIDTANAIVDTPDRTNTILALGRFSKEKGFDLLIDAFSELASKYPHWKLKIIGNGPLFETYQQRINSLGMEKQILLPGRIPGDQIHKELQAGKIFVLSSRYEGFPNALLEAMANGLAVLATQTNGVPDIITNGKNGLIVPVENRNALKSKLDQLITDKDLRSNLSNEALKITQKFDQSTILKKWEQTIIDHLKNK